MKRKFDVEKAPRVLAIHLKRFGDSLGYSRSKITRNISFQQNFRLGSRSYELRAVCNHSGGGKYDVRVRRTSGSSQSGR